MRIVEIGEVPRGLCKECDYNPDYVRNGGEPKPARKLADFEANKANKLRFCNLEKCKFTDKA